ncbi:MAG: tetratricopeptide repeat protein [Candidatus Hodarchaeota archaeon]
MEKILDLTTNNLNFLGNLYIKTKQISKAIATFEEEASLYEMENPRKQIKIYMVIAKEFKKAQRFKESIEFAEKAFYLASEHEINDQIQKILEFLIEACKLGDNIEKLANFKKLLYQV